MRVISPAFDCTLARVLAIEVGGIASYVEDRGAGRIKLFSTYCSILTYSLPFLVIPVVIIVLVSVSTSSKLFLCPPGDLFLIFGFSCTISSSSTLCKNELILISSPLPVLRVPITLLRPAGNPFVPRPDGFCRGF